MIFKKDDGSKKAADEIKQAIEADNDLVEQPVDDGSDLGIPAEPGILPEPKYSQPEEIGAPLFIKIEKYKDVISTVQEMKLFVSSVKNVFSIMQEAEHVKQDSLGILKVTLQRLEKAVLEMDSELLRPHGISVYSYRGEPEAKQIESSLSELQKQLLELRQELRGIR